MFQTILFDIDGVMLSEERYFDASALTVYELLCSPQYLNLKVNSLPEFHPDVNEDEIRQIRTAVFASNHALQTMKRCGVNANWDMVYLQTAFQVTELLKQFKEAGVELSPVRRIVQNGWTQTALQSLGDFIRHSDVQYEIDFERYVQAFSDCEDKEELFKSLESRLSNLFASDITPLSANRTFWLVGQSCFQEWYLGDEYVSSTKQPGKRGFLKDEDPIVEPHALADLFATCKSQGIRIGIGTGRPDIETRVPLTEMGWWAFFDETNVSTASDVLDAEHQLPESAPLSKPHPFAYLRSFLGEDNAREVLNHALPLPKTQGDKVLVVGDSVADALAAKALGCRFAAVLTGLEGEAAKPQFEEIGADYIFSNVLELKTIL